MSKCTTHNDINLSSSTTEDDDISNNLDKLTTADDGDARSTKSEEKCTSCEQNLEEHIKKDDISSNINDNVKQDIVLENTGSNFEASDTLCANCGKEGAKNICNKCKSVKYCNAACKKKHRHKHKKECEEHLRGAAELREEEMRRAAELHDKELFKNPPQRDDCPICFLRLPTHFDGNRYKSCCGKVICSGCLHAVQKADGFVGLCPFCRTPTPDSDRKIIKRLHKRMEVGDAKAINQLAGLYSKGTRGFAQDHTKALELWERAAELGNAPAYSSIANVYYYGRCVEKDMKRAENYYELAAMRGSAAARHNLGVLEDNAGNKERALKHYMIAVEVGSNDSLKEIQDLYSRGLATKDEYTTALRAYQKYLDEVKSSQRDEAAAFDEDYEYIET